MSKIPTNRKAPPPDRPLNVVGSGIHFLSQIKTKTPDWNFWGAMPKATHLQACILSIGIDPDSLLILDQYAIAILSIETQEILIKRLRLLDAKRCDRTIFTQPMEQYSGLNTKEVLLSEFAAWGVSLGWGDMPQELSARAQGRATSPPAGVTLPTPDASDGSTVSPTAPPLASNTQAAPASGPTPAELRLRIDITAERGGRRRILEKWSDIEKEYGPIVDGRQVQRVLKRDIDEKDIALKTVQNHLAKLRREGLIP